MDKIKTLIHSALNTDIATGKNLLGIGAGIITIVKYAEAGDKLALNLIDRLYLYISIGLVNLINKFDPQIIYLGHDIALADSLLIEKMISYLEDKPFSSRYKSIPIEISAFRDKLSSVLSPCCWTNYSAVSTFIPFQENNTYA